MLLIQKYRFLLLLSYYNYLFLRIRQVLVSYLNTLDLKNTSYETFVEYYD